MPDNFSQFVKFIFAEEDGFNDDPHDPGGATNFGISLRFYRSHINKDATVKDIKDLTISAATSIYKDWFWDLNNCDEMPAPIALLMFDMSANQGPGTAIKCLQYCLGHPHNEADGIYGPKTNADTQKQYVEHGVYLINHLCAQRAYQYGLIDGQFKRIGLGWMQRTMEAHEYALRIFNQEKADAKAKAENQIKETN